MGLMCIPSYHVVYTQAKSETLVEIYEHSAIFKKVRGAAADIFCLLSIFAVFKKREPASKNIQYLVLETIVNFFFPLKVTKYNIRLMDHIATRI